MAGHLLLSGLITVLGAFLLRAGAQQQEVVKLVGDNVTLVPTYTGNPTEINWKINGDKLVDMTLDPYDEHFYRLQDRASIDRTNGALTIRNLTIGDSGDYLAEPVVNGHFQYKDFRLTVRACPAEPTISDDSTEETIVLRCDSSSPDVRYEWFNKTVSISKNPSYTEPRPKHNVNLTCVVDNGVCKKTAFKIISYTPEPSGLSGGIITAIVIAVLVLALFLILLLIALCYHFRHKKCIGRVYSAITNKKESRVNFFRCVHSLFFFCFKESRENFFRNAHYVIGNDEATPAEQQPLNPVESCNSITVFQEEDRPKGRENPRLTINVKPEERGRSTIEVLQSDGKKYELLIEETEGPGIIKLEEDRVTLTRSDKVAKIAWKKDGVAQFEWAASGLKLHTDDIILGPGSVTVQNAEGSGESYTVQVHSTDNTFQLEGNNHVNNPPIYELEEVETAPPPEGGQYTGYEPPESKPIVSVTFHPKNLPSEAPITWKKDDQPVNIGDGGGRIKSYPNGDLTINNVTSGDKGKYTVYSEDQQLEPQFTLSL